MHEPQQSFQYSPLGGRPELPKLEVPSLARERCAMLARVTRDQSLFSEERLALLLRVADGILAPTLSDPSSMPRVITAFAASLAARWRSAGEGQPELQAAMGRARDRLAAIVRSHAVQFSPQELSHLVRAMERMKLRDAACAEALALASERPMWQRGPQNVVEHLVGLNKIGLARGELLGDAAVMMVPHLSELPIYSIHKLMGLLMGLPRGESGAVSKIAEALTSRVSEMAPRELATAARLFSSSSHRPMPLLAAVISRATERTSEFSQRELLDMLRSASELQSEETQRLFSAAVPLVRGYLSAGSLPASRIATTLGSYARVHVFDHKLVKTAISQLAGRVKELTPEQATTAACALGAFSICNKAILTGIREVIIPDLKSLEPHVLARLAWSFAVLRWRDEELFGKIAEAARDALPRFPGISLSSLAWSFANVAIADRALFEAIASKVRPGGPLERMRSGRIAWSMAVVAPDLLPSCFSREDLHQTGNVAEWHQYYQALLVSGEVSPLERFPRMTEADNRQTERPANNFESDVHRVLRERLRILPQRIDAGRLVAGIETDFIIRTEGRPVVVECDGDAYHRTQGPDGGTSTGADILQDRLLERCGYVVFHVSSSDFYGPHSAKVFSDLEAVLRQERQRGPLPGGLRRLSP